MTTDPAKTTEGFPLSTPLEAGTYSTAPTVSFSGAEDGAKITVGQSQTTPWASHHKPVTTLEELDALDNAELIAGHMSAEKGDPEPGMNHTRSYHHGWRTRMMDLHEIGITPQHRELTRLWCARERNKRSAETHG